MPTYEIEYEYPVIEEDAILVEANDIDEAEQVALDRLSEELPPDVTELDIRVNTIREVKPNAQDV